MHFVCIQKIKNKNIPMVTSVVQIEQYWGFKSRTLKEQGIF